MPFKTHLSQVMRIKDWIEYQRQLVKKDIKSSANPHHQNIVLSSSNGVAPLGWALLAIQRASLFTF